MYRVDVEEATLKYLNIPKVVGDIPNVITSYLRKDISWVELVQKAAPYITPRSRERDPLKCWDSQSGPTWKPNKNTRKRKKYWNVQKGMG